MNKTSASGRPIRFTIGDEFVPVIEAEKFLFSKTFTGKPSPRSTIFWADARKTINPTDPRR